LDLPALIQQYGYLAVFFGSVLEGETLLVLAGLAAHRGYLSLQWVVAIAALGAFIGDQTCFLIGRLLGQRVLARWPRLEPSVARADALLARYGTVLVIGLRFTYGLRLGGTIAIGMSRMPWLRFAGLNFVGALLWAPIIAGAGYLLGNAIEPLLAHARYAEYGVFAVVIIAGITLWLIRTRARSARARSRARDIGAARGPDRAP
jgi:membrane protein DedA with SNARE-associated domain